MSADRNYYIAVKNGDVFEEKESGGAYCIIANFFEDENCGIKMLPEEILNETRKQYEEQFQGQYEFWYEKEGFILDFIENVDKFDLLNKYIKELEERKEEPMFFGDDEDLKDVSEAEEADLEAKGFAKEYNKYEILEAKKFMEICNKYKDMPRESVKIGYIVTY